MDILEKMLAMWEPLLLQSGLGYPLFLFVSYILYRVLKYLVPRYVTAISENADSSSAVAATLESMEASMSAAISKCSERLDRIDGTTTKTLDHIERATSKKP